MGKVTYQQCEQSVPIQNVFVDNLHVGVIFRTQYNSYYYAPKCGRPGKEFGTLAALKRDLEGVDG